MFGIIKSVLIVRAQISIKQLKRMADKMFGNLVKVVVDVEREVMAIDGELHADEEALLLKDGSKQESLWGINLYPSLPEKEWLEYDSIINLRPSLGNSSRRVDNRQTKKKISKIVNHLVKR